MCNPSRPASPGMLASASAPSRPGTDTRQDARRRLAAANPAAGGGRARGDCVRAARETPGAPWSPHAKNRLTLLVLGVADVAAQVAVAIVEGPQTLCERGLCLPVCHLSAGRGPAAGAAPLDSTGPVSPVHGAAGPCPPPRPC